LIELKPESSTIDKSEKFSIATWLAIPESPTSYEYKNLRETFELERTYTKAEIEEKFFNLITECNEKLEEINEEFEIAIEWILPNDLLSLDIDCWNYREGTAIACGPFRSVHVRSSQRLHIAYKHCRPLWRKKWEYLLNNFQQINLSHYILACQCNSKSEEDLKIVDNQKKILGINFPTDLQKIKNISYDFIIETGIPLALWSRYKGNNVNHIIDLDTLINSDQGNILNLQTLSQSIQTMRLAARSNRPNHLGHHLCFLWENPYNYPQKRKLGFN
jgi:vacuolar-type H+-ATPase subunit D/Vma8